VHIRFNATKSFKSLYPLPLAEEFRFNGELAGWRFEAGLAD
jgi:hypothetical protein